mgnify:CR=1 FL=1
MNRKMKCVMGSGCALLLAGAASAATTWKVSTAVTDGMTGPQQITNALTQCASGDTILVDPGSYDFTGIYMDAANKIHLTRKDNPIATFSLVGNTESHWAEGGGVSSSQATVSWVTFGRIPPGRDGAGRIRALQTSFSTDSRPRTPMAAL